MADIFDRLWAANQSHGDIFDRVAASMNTMTATDNVPPHMRPDYVQPQARFDNEQYRPAPQRPPPPAVALQRQIAAKLQPAQPRGIPPRIAELAQYYGGEERARAVADLIDNIANDFPGHNAQIESLVRQGRPPRVIASVIRAAADKESQASASQLASRQRFDKSDAFLSELEKQTRHITDPAKIKAVAEITAKLATVKDALPSMKDQKEKEHARSVAGDLIAQRVAAQQVPDKKYLETVAEGQQKAAQAAGRSMAQWAVPSTAAMASGAGVMKLAAGRVNPVVGVIGGLIAGAVAAGTASKAQDESLRKIMGDEWVNSLQRQMAEDRANPDTAMASFMGEQVPMVLAGKSPKIGAAAKALYAGAGRAAQKIATGKMAALTAEETRQLFDVAFGGGTGLAMESVRQVKEGDFRPLELAASTVLNSGIVGIRGQRDVGAAIVDKRPTWQRAGGDVSTPKPQVLKSLTDLPPDLVPPQHAPTPPTGAPEGAINATPDAVAGAGVSTIRPPPKGAQDAQAIRSDQGQPPQKGKVAQAVKNIGSQDIQQPAPRPPDAPAQTRPDAEVQLPIDSHTINVKRMDIPYHDRRIAHGRGSVGSAESPLNDPSGQQFFKSDGFWFMRNGPDDQYHRITDPTFATQIERSYAEVPVRVDADAIRDQIADLPHKQARDIVVNAAKDAGVSVKGSNEAILGRIDKAASKPAATVKESAADKPSMRSAQAQTSAQPPPPESLAEKGAKAAQAGFARVGEIDPTSGLGRAASQLRSLLSWNRGVGEETYAQFNAARAAMRSADTIGKIIRTSGSRLVKELGNAHNPEDVMRDVGAAVDGTLSLPEFGKKYGIDYTDEGLKTLAEAKRLSTARASKIADLLDSAGVSQELVERVRTNPNYLTTFYEKFVVGKGFTPTDAAVQAAEVEVQEVLQSAISKVSASGQQLRTAGLDVKGYLETGNAALLSALPADARVAATSLRHNYGRIKQVIGALDQSGNTFVARENADALSDAASSLVDFYAGRQPTKRSGAAWDVNNLMKLHLDGAFKQLYGEVTDPIFRLAKSAEVQGRLLTQLTFYNRLSEAGDGTMYSGLRSKQQGFTERLGEDTEAYRRKYGRMAGKWVSPELKQLLDGPRGVWAKDARDAWAALQGFQRTMALAGIKATGRNAISSVAQFAMGNGDATHLQYWKHLLDSARLIKGLARQEKWALREMSRLERMDVFSADAQSVNEAAKYIHDSAVATRVIGAKGQRAVEMWRKLYAMIDFPAKYAAYKTQIGLGRSAKEAAAHVQKYYQYSANVPEITRAMNRVGVGDYTTYVLDATRIAKNQMLGLFEQNISGTERARRLLGFTTARAFQTVTNPKVATLGAAGYAAVHQWLRNNVAQEGAQIDDTVPLKPDAQHGLRTFLPDYYKNETQLGWVENRRDGEKVLYYTILGGNAVSAFPLEDMMAGALQVGGEGGSFTAAAGEQLRDIFGPSMTAQTAWDASQRAAEIYKMYKTSGDAGVDSPDMNDKILDLSLEIVRDLLGPTLGKLPQDVVQSVQEDKLRREPKPGSLQARRTLRDVLGTQLALVRTYRVDKEAMGRMIVREALKITRPVRGAKSAISAAEREKSQFVGETPVAPATEQRAAKNAIYRKALLSNLRIVMNEAGSVVPDWFTQDELRALLQDPRIGLSKDEIDAVLSGGDISDYSPGGSGSFSPRDRIGIGGINSTP